MNGLKISRKPRVTSHIDSYNGCRYPAKHNFQSHVLQYVCEKEVVQRSVKVVPRNLFFYQYPTYVHMVRSQTLEATIHGPLSLPPENNQKELNETTKPTWNLWYMEVVRFEHLLFLEFQTLFVKGIASRQHERAGRK